MPEIAFLDAVRSYLAGSDGVSPAPAAIGFEVPVQGAGFPMLTLSLDTVSRMDIGLGGGATVISEGSLPVTSTIDLANPVLPGPDGFVLLDPTRRMLILPHGGLVRADRLDGPLGPGDLAVTVAGAVRTLVVGPPGPGEFSVDPLEGGLAFGAPLPASGDLVAQYHLGVWGRTTTLIAGELVLGAWDTNLSRLVQVSGSAVRALLAGTHGALPGLEKIRLVSLGEIGSPQAAQPGARERRARFGFHYQHIADAPVSSGGIIRRVPITTRLAAFVRDPATGALVETVEVEAEE